MYLLIYVFLIPIIFTYLSFSSPSYTNSFENGPDRILVTSSLQVSPQDVAIIYVAVFGRAPDGQGFNYWLEQAQTYNWDLRQLANNMYYAAILYPEYSYISDYRILIEHLYQNVLGKAPGEDQEGINYWVSQIDKGILTPGEAISAIIYAAITQYPFHPATKTLKNRAQFAEYVAQVIQNPDVNGDGNVDDTDFQIFRQLINMVTDDPNSIEAAKNYLNQIASNLPNINPNPSPVPPSPPGEGSGKHKVPQFNFKLTSSTYPESADMNKACKDEFGPEWRLADWNDLKNFYNNGGDLTALLDYLGMKYYPDRLQGDSAWVSVNGEEFYSSGRHYFIARHDHETSFLCQYGRWPGGACFLEHDQLDNHLISLGSWYGEIPVLCYKDNPSASLLFEETFDTLDNWYLVVYDSAGGSASDPAPKLDLNMGNPAPSLDVNGDSWCGDGAYSKQTFDYSNGLIIEWDMYVEDKRFEGCWVGGDFGLSDHLPNLSNPRGDGAYVDADRCDTSHVAGVYLQAVGPLCWGEDSSLTGHAYLLFSILAEDGTPETYEVVGDWADNLLGDWHKYKIYIRPDGYVEFYIDGKLRWKSTKRINMAMGKLPLLAGRRDEYGPVRIDNVKVYKPTNDITYPEPVPLPSPILEPIPEANIIRMGYEIMKNYEGRNLITIPTQVNPIAYITEFKYSNIVYDPIKNEIYLDTSAKGIVDGFIHLYGLNCYVNGNFECQGSGGRIFYDNSSDVVKADTPFECSTIVQYDCGVDFGTEVDYAHCSGSLLINPQDIDWYEHKLTGKFKLECNFDKFPQLDFSYTNMITLQGR